MNRRSFLGLLGSLPFLRWLKPKERTYHGLLVEEYQYPLPDFTNPTYMGVPVQRFEGLDTGHYYMLAREHRAKGGKMLIEGMDDELWR